MVTHTVPSRTAAAGGRRRCCHDHDFTYRSNHNRVRAAAAQAVPDPSYLELDWFFLELLMLCDMVRLQLCWVVHLFHPLMYTGGGPSDLGATTAALVALSPEPALRTVSDSTGYMRRASIHI
jgi:hypothetical protein